MSENKSNEVQSVLQRNTKLMVILANGDGNSYDSRIEDIDDDQLMISMPTNRGRPMPVAKGSILNVSAIAGNGKSDFDCRVLSVVKTPIYMLVVTLPDALRHEQMREFFRVPVHLRVKVFLGNLDKLDIFNKTSRAVPFYDGLVDDLSGGGCRLSCDSGIIEGDVIVLDLSNSLVDGIKQLECKAVRVAFRPNGKRIISLKYSNISETNRDKIIRYVFRRQLELKKLSGE
ncbi:MAG: flagellar brake domain-containing protein [Deferribacteraceae bacterium]|jgi:c-di-GMP-binding flagellar brake protein YcgR|nr:flagellar brake domain-containing protein [Deferribacteraceae bacterium]